MHLNIPPPDPWTLLGIIIGIAEPLLENQPTKDTPQHQETEVQAR